MNSISLTGRLTRDPELRELAGGDPVCKMRIAVENMAPQRETGYIDVTCFGKPGLAAHRVLTKGWLVAVDGRLQYETWVRDDEARHTYTIVGSVEFLAAPRVQTDDEAIDEALAAEF